MITTRSDRAELRCGHKVVAAFGPVVIYTEKARYGDPRKWIVKGPLNDFDKFYIKHSPAQQCKVRFDMGGGKWWALDPIASFDVRPGPSGQILTVRANGDEKHE